jgi:hypothetical protein
MARGCLVALVLSLTSTGLHAQTPPPPLSVIHKRDLAFGSVLPGVPTTVLPNDVARAGEFEITGPANCSIQIQFLLPPALIGPGNAAMPVSFGPLSAGFSATGSITNQEPFDPAIPFSTNLPSGGRASGFLGGVLTPSATQAPGSYSGAATITVAPTCT